MTKEEQTNLCADYICHWIIWGLSENPYDPEYSKLSSALKAKGKQLAKTFVKE